MNVPTKAWKRTRSCAVSYLNIHYVSRQYGDFRDRNHYNSSEATQEKSCQPGPQHSSVNKHVSWKVRNKWTHSHSTEAGFYMEAAVCTVQEHVMLENPLMHPGCSIKLPSCWKRTFNLTQVFFFLWAASASCTFLYFYISNLLLNLHLTYLICVFIFWTQE